MCLAAVIRMFWKIKTMFRQTFICIFPHLKMEASIWTALEGSLVSVFPEAIPAIHFCWKQKRGEKRAYEYTKSRKKSSKKPT